MIVYFNFMCTSLAQMHNRVMYRENHFINVWKSNKTIYSVAIGPLQSLGRINVAIGPVQAPRAGRRRNPARRRRQDSPGRIPEGCTTLCNPGVPWVPWPMSLVVVFLDRGAGPPRGGGPWEQLLGNPLGGGFRWSAEHC